MSASRIIRAEGEKKNIGLQEIGILSIGQKDPTRGFPTSLNYFRPRGKNDTPCSYGKQFKEAFGEKPTVIPIVFFTDDDSINCQEQWEAYTGGNRLGVGDGENFTVWDANAPHPTDKAKKGDYVKVAGKDHPLVKAIGKAWKVRLTLRFVIPKIKGVIGSWTFKTGGEKSTIPSIVAAYDQIKLITGGTIKLIPFDLIVTAVKSSNPGEAKQFKTVSLVPSISAEKIDELKGFLSAGNDLAQLGTFVMDETKLHSIATNTEVKQIAAQPITEDHSHVVVNFDEPPVEEKPSTMKPNLKADDAEVIIKKVTPSLKDAAKTHTPEDLFKKEGE